MNPVQMKSYFIKKVQRTKDTYSFFFKKPDYFEFTAGQYNKWTIPVEHPDERGNWRFFTISSAPYEEDLMITTKIVQSTFKKTLLTLNEHQEIDVYGPLGTFTLGNPAEHHVFLAGGIGLTPYHSMIKQAAHAGWTTPITLIVSYSTTEDILFHDEFQTIAQEHTWFMFHETITKPEVSKQPWTGSTGRVDEAMIRNFVPDFQTCIFYLCGPPPMVEALQKVMIQIGIGDKQVRIERFTGY